jgi:DNA-binding HxlR family transcriptional regulator
VGATTALAQRSRAGGEVLALLSDALNSSILRALMGGPLSVPELGRRLGPTSRTTRFSRLRDLERLGIITREKRPGTPPVAYCGLSPSGRELLPVVRRFARWLAESPDAPSSPDELDGARSIKALAVAWDTTVLRWLAERPCSVTELDSLSPPDVTHHEVRTARESLSGVGMISPVASDERGQPYAANEWTRRAAGCIAAAIRWKKAFLAGARPPSPAEAEGLLRLLLPLVEIQPTLQDGVCTLRIDRHANLPVLVMGDGRIVPCEPPPDHPRVSQVSGDAEAWFRAFLDGRTDSLRMRGGIHLTVALAGGLHRACMQPSATDDSATLDKCSDPMYAISTREIRTAPISRTFSNDPVKYL